MRDYVAEAKALGNWYHAIQLTPEFITTPTLPITHQWESNRKVRAALDYKGKTVLDLGTMDGMWAYEAEALGAKTVVASDIWQGPATGFHRFMLAREAMKSNVWVVTNADVHDLYNRMRSVMEHLGIAGFDIVQCLGLLYHVQNPMLALHQIRRCMVTGSVLFLETAFWRTTDERPMARFNSDLGVYNDGSTYWAMNQRCLVDMLKMCGFVARLDTASRIEKHEIGRIAILCDAVVVHPTVDNFGT